MLNKSDINTILRKIKQAYPNSYGYLNVLAADEKNIELGEIVELWLDCFREFAFEKIETALKEFIKTDRSGFPPTPGQIRGIIEDNAKKQESEKFFLMILQRSNQRLLGIENSNLIEGAE